MKTENDIYEAYYAWLTEKVSRGYENVWRTRTRLLQMLMETEFYYILPMDGNREADGIDMRYEFAYETGEDPVIVASSLDILPCSVLEMMAALAFRCECDIMGVGGRQDRLPLWFFSMAKSLGILPYTDKKFDEKCVNDILVRFMDRKIGYNGEGGLFTVRDTRGHDMRSTEIWYQMSLYLDEVIEREDDDGR